MYARETYFSRKHSSKAGKEPLNSENDATTSKN